MKKFLGILLTCYFLTLSIGVGIFTHYCNGRPVTTSVMVQAPACGMDQVVSRSCSEPQFSRKGCCEDEYRLIRFEEQYFSQQFQAHIAATYTLQPFYCNGDFSVTPAGMLHVRLENKPPPLKPAQRLALIQVFRC